MSLSRKQFLKFLGLGSLASGLGGFGLPLAAAQAAKARSGAPRMAIKDIEIYAFDLPLVAPFRISIGEMKAANDVLVRVRTDSGLVGVGEACPFPPITGETQATNIAAARAIRDMLIGRDPLAIDDVLRLIGPVVHSNPSMVAAFEMACFDILGQAAGLPLYRLLGGTKSTFESDITTGIDTAEATAASTRKHAGLGYKTLKIKIGVDPDQDFERLRAVRQAVGDGLTLRVDANQGYSVPQAIYSMKKIAPLGIQLVEQPVVASDVDGLKAVRAESPIPIMADEALFGPADAIRLIKAEACDFLNIKLMKAGGILNSVRIAHIADAANMRCMVGCMLESRIALTAAAHVVASQANIVFADLDGNADHTADPVVGGLTTKGGMVTMPETPGLGCDVDPTFLKKLARI
ncbi:MAG TPA: dipeptide epimerase [Candidatus Aminicenantes bacterium]|nr:dipeptide epimerase [Candidatus Aminicenantes bacterium]HRY63904.1 dipeptide epimerase [Candidatus Aminicenantes bacterium]HRZ70817.1 dipeptide epimerase [Candidatus Aminicenantes bacterium]